MRVVIAGYYGFGNVGDEAILAATLPALRRRVPAADVTVISGDPAQTARLHGVRSVPRRAAARVLAGADLFLFGGGSLIQDVTSARSAAYYIGLLGLATLLARRTIVFAQGVGPLRRRWLRLAATAVLNRVDVVTVRDDDSRAVVQDLGVQRPVHVVADPVFAMPFDADAQQRTPVSSLPAPRLGLALRPWSGDAYLEPLIDAMTAVRERTGGTVIALPFHPERDMRVCAVAACGLGGKVVAGLSPLEMAAAVSSLDILVGVRLHALIAAAAAGVPVVGLAYDPKVDALFRRLGAGPPLPIAHLQARQIQRAVTIAWESRAALRSALRERTAALRADALRGVDLAAALLTASVRASPPRR